MSFVQIRRCCRPDFVQPSHFAADALVLLDCREDRIILYAAEGEGIMAVGVHYVRRLIPLAFLAPDIVETIVDGEQPIDLTAARLTGGIELPHAWAKQQRLLCG